MIRRAEAQDARLIQRLIVDHLTKNADSFVRPTLASIRDRSSWPHIVAFVDPEEGTYCEIIVEENRQDFQVTSWYPRGRALGALMPVLAAAVRVLAARWPQGMNWIVWGDFSDGVDDQRERDQGRSQTEAYKRVLLDDRGREVVQTSGALERGTAYARLRDLIKVVDAAGL